MIEVENLRFAYPGATEEVLRSVSFSVRPGTVYGLLGPSGAGKSTTQKILMGLLRGFAGRAEVFGRPVAERGPDFYERIGVCFELPSLYLRLTARENLGLFAALYEKRTRDPIEVLAMVDLVDAADQRVESFSKGMKMRLNLCRALLHDPEMLFLDEPTTGQDPERARTTRELIVDLKRQGRTVFLTTHNMAEAAEICDEVGFLVNGTIPVSGAPEALMRAQGRRTLEVSVETGRGIDKLSFPMDGIGHNRAFAELLETDTVVAIHSLEASLDDIFIKAVKGEIEQEAAR